MSTQTASSRSSTTTTIEDKSSLDNKDAVPIVSSYNKKIAPLLDCIDKLRHLRIMQEGIQLPTIVVVGDQSSGKSSVLESLAGISLPRGQGICTRVPLIMRLQTHDDPEPKLYLEYNGKEVETDEKNVSSAINLATDEMAGTGKGIAKTPLTLMVKKKGIPNLTMVDLPGITRVAVHGQPKDIQQQVSATIMEYITPIESIILNVLSAEQDFSVCESISMSQTVDKTGERTLAVVTKVDKAPEGLLKKVTDNDVNIGLGYVCVRNRIGSESYEIARMEEARLFESHPLLSKLSKSMVGIPALAKKLVEIQATIISKCLPNIIKTISEKLSSYLVELTKLPENLSSVAEATTTFFRILSNSKETLKKILVKGEFDEYPKDIEMHCTARLAEMLHDYNNQLQAKRLKYDPKDKFLIEEIKLLEETKGISLPNFLPRAAFRSALQQKVEAISSAPVAFVEEAWTYIERIIVPILMHHSESYPQLQSSTRRAAQNLIAKKMDQAIQWVSENIEMEKLTDYTCNPGYVTSYNKLMAQQGAFMEIMNNVTKPSQIMLEEFGLTEVGHLRSHLVIVQQAFDLKMRMTVYWKIVLRRLVDNMALHLLYSINNLVNKELESEIIAELMAPNGGGIERLLEEAPAVAEKRSRLKQRIKLLRDSKEVVANMMDRIATRDN